MAFCNLSQMAIVSQIKNIWNTEFRAKRSRVSAVGLCRMGMSHAYGAPADKQQMAGHMADAVDMGYTFFDTAEVYCTPARMTTESCWAGH